MSAPSPPRYEVTVDRKVMIPMADGTRLAADIYRPRADGTFPAIVERTPYNREESVILRTQTPQYMAQRGFVFVVQDVRGRFGSEGTWYPFVDDGWGERQDGYDTIQWVARQPWCNGKVATAGGSYAGQTQMFLAPTRPPALVACFVREAASTLAEQWVYRGGAVEWAFNCDWTMRHGNFALRRQLDLLQTALGQEQERFTGLPLASDPIWADPFHWMRDLLAHADDEDFWEAFNFEPQYRNIDVPIYHMAGWFDIFLEGTLRNFAGLAANARSKETRRNQKLIIGPWTHGPSVHDPAFARQVGAMDFGPEATLDFNAEMLRWYDHWLNGTATGVLDEPRVRYFLMGANEWRTADTWPPPEAELVPYYLRQGGALSRDEPGRKEGADGYEYDPAKPVPTLGGNTLYRGPLGSGPTGEESPNFAVTSGPQDQRPVEDRCLLWTSEPLEADLDVVGPVQLTLYASSDCVDTDFVAKLSDVFPDGRSILVVDGILRARYRKGRFRPKLLRPGKVYRFTLDLWPTAWRFAAGHRLRVAVTSSNFPRFDRNLNTGHNPARFGDMKVAANTVYHDRKHPSHMTLPVMASV